MAAAGDESNELNNSAYRGDIKLSEEYLQARRNLMKKGLGSLAGFDIRKSQRILKVVNIIGSKASNRESSLSATRVSQIRSRQYKSKGEKVIFKHTASREQLMLSSDFGLSFSQRATPELTEDVNNGRKSELTGNRQKNKLKLLSNASLDFRSSANMTQFYKPKHA